MFLKMLNVVYVLSFTLPDNMAPKEAKEKKPAEAKEKKVAAPVVKKVAAPVKKVEKAAPVKKEKAPKKVYAPIVRVAKKPKQYVFSPFLFPVSFFV